MPRNRSVAHGDLALESDCFLVVGVDGDGAQRELARFAAVTSFEKDLAEKNVRVDQFGIPEDRRLQRRDRCFLIAATKIDATAEQISFRVCRLDHHDAMEFGQCLFIAPGLIKIARFDEQVLRGRARRSHARR